MKKLLPHLSMKNITVLGSRIEKIIISLPENIRSLWIGNKAIYRSRMAVKTGGELIIIGKGISTAGEDRTLDALIRKYGYRGNRKNKKCSKRKQGSQGKSCCGCTPYSRLI